MRRWRRGIHTAARLQKGDGLHDTSLGSGSTLPDGASTSSAPHLDEKTRQKRRATLWGKLSVGAGKMRDEEEELPYQSKALEQQHWLEMIDGKVSRAERYAVYIPIGVNAEDIASIWSVSLRWPISFARSKED